MASVRIVSTTVVGATASQESVHRIELSVIDARLLLIGTIQKGLLFSKPKSSQVAENFIKHLKSSLSTTLNHFFPRAGRLATLQQDEKTVSFFIDCNNAGADFVHAVAENVTISDILDPIYVPQVVHSFFPLNGIINCEFVSKPLLAVQVTELVDGIFIGCTISHSVADGTAFWTFINCWSEISRGGSDQLPKPPVFDCWLRNQKSYCPVDLPLSAIRTDDKFTRPQLQERVFHFSKENIARLKAKAIADAGGIDNISSLQSTLAHLWRSIIRNRHLDPNEDAIFLLPIGLRSRMLQSQIPKEYFGNAIKSEIVKCKVKELLDHDGLGYAALQMNKTVACFAEDNIKEYLESFKKNPDLRTMSGFTRIGLLISGSPRFNVYSNDFGWGRPMAVKSGLANKFDGQINLYEGVEEGSIDIEVCLLPQVLLSMGSDSEFMDAVTL